MKELLVMLGATSLKNNCVGAIKRDIKTGWIGRVVNQNYSELKHIIDSLSEVIFVTDIRLNPDCN